MNQEFRIFFSIVSLLVLSLGCPEANAGTPSAGGLIVYGPDSYAIPALSDAMLVILAMLFVVVAFRAFRAHPGGKPLASILALGVLALAAANGHRLIEDAMAIGLAFSVPNGGSIHAPPGVELSVTNITGKTQRVISVNPDLGYVSIPTSGSPQCAAGLQVANNNYCFIYFGLPPQ
jgi:hypothetical protein